MGNVPNVLFYNLDGVKLQNNTFETLPTIPLYLLLSFYLELSHIFLTELSNNRFLLKVAVYYL